MYSSTLSLTSVLGGLVVNATPRAALPPVETLYLLYRTLDGPQSRSGKVRKISSQPGFDPRTVQPVASLYGSYFIRVCVVCR